MNDIAESEVDKRLDDLLRDADATGYHLNPDSDMTRDLVKGLCLNSRRYGYEACPCRLCIGPKEDNLDIICPCDYRDDDLEEYGCCYCALYVSEEIARGEKSAVPIPERRSCDIEERKRSAGPVQSLNNPRLAWPVFRCRVCGYLCARSSPPEICPICKAKKERFILFME